MTTLRPALCFLCAMLVAPCATATEFKAVGATPAVLFDAPGQKSRKLFIAPPGMPLEIVLVNGEWSRVRDASGDLSWVETRLLSGPRALVVELPVIQVRAAANETSPVTPTESTSPGAHPNALLKMMRASSGPSALPAVEIASKSDATGEKEPLPSSTA